MSWHCVDFELQMVVRNGVGFDNVDIAAARRLGIPVCNVPDYGTEEVADHALALTLALQPQYLPMLRDVRKGAWQWRIAESSRRLRGPALRHRGADALALQRRYGRKRSALRFSSSIPICSSGYEKALGVDRCQPDLLNVGCRLTALPSRKRPGA